MSDGTEGGHVAEFRKLARLDEMEDPIDLPELHHYLLLPFSDGHPELRFSNWQLSLCVLPSDENCGSKHGGFATSNTSI
jgi:hypothetical protein